MFVELSVIVDRLLLGETVRYAWKESSKETLANVQKMVDERSKMKMVLKMSDKFTTRNNEVGVELWLEEKVESQ